MGERDGLPIEVGGAWQPLFDNIFEVIMDDVLLLVMPGDPSIVVLNSVDIVFSSPCI